MSRFEAVSMNDDEGVPGVRIGREKKKVSKDAHSLRAEYILSDSLLFVTQIQPVSSFLTPRIRAKSSSAIAQIFVLQSTGGA